jgi:hypothetical protein
LIGCPANSAKEAELAALVDRIAAYQARRWPGERSRRQPNHADIGLKYVGTD